jgi:hypothetical protein
MGWPEKFVTYLACTAGIGSRPGGTDKAGFHVRKTLLLISANQAVVMPRSRGGRHERLGREYARGFNHL